MGKKSNAPTMKDVAAEAGVALGTVSKVVNGLPVGEEYQKRVNKAIKKLGYRVNTYAQGLRADKTRTVAFLIPNTDNPFFGRLTYHVNRFLAERGYRMLLCCTDAQPDLEQNSLDMAQQNSVCGIISLTYNNSLNFQADLPQVSIDRHISSGIPCVSSDNFGGGQLAVKTLSDLGCKRLAFLGTGSPLSNEVVKRCDGFRSACSALEIEHETLMVHDGTPYSVFEDFLSDHMTNGKLRFDGLFCITDNLASLTIAYLRAKSIRIPEDVQVIGFDGLRDYATGDLLCSTIVQPIEQIAKISVDMVLSADWNQSPSLVCLPVEYAYGKTTREKPV